MTNQELTRSPGSTRTTRNSRIPIEVINGGIITTLIDLSSGRPLSTTFDDDEDYQLATTEVTVKIPPPPATDDLRATATLIRRGNTLGVTRVDVESGPDADPDIIAIGTTTYRISTSTLPGLAYHAHQRAYPVRLTNGEKSSHSRKAVRVSFDGKSVNVTREVTGRIHLCLILPIRMLPSPDSLRVTSRVLIYNR